ncbi:hypothetical protein D3C77_534300 [compost metagenome]
MPFVGILFRRRIAFPLRRQHMNQYRAAYIIGLGKGFDQSRQVMTVNRAKIRKAEFFKKNTGYHHIFQAILQPLRRFGELAADRWNFLEQLLYFIFGAQIIFIRSDLRQVIVHRPNIRRNRHFIVIQNNH